MPGLHDVCCVVHVHSIHSDGTGTVSQIVAAARASGADALLLTDHDTLAARDEGWEGWQGSLLVLVGEEVSPVPPTPHPASGLPQPVDHRGLDGPAIVAAVREAGGFGFAAHPFSAGNPGLGRAGKAIPWLDLDAPGLTGVELWN